MEKIEAKQGATLSLAGTFSLPDGTWSVASNVEKKDGTLICAADVTIEPIDPVGADGKTHSVLWTVSAAHAEAFEVGQTYVSDIIFTDDSPNPVVLKTSTFGIKVVREVT
ncbi:MAG: hypothetical protein ACEQSH_00770 [Bacteroidia bacterium]